MVFMYEVSFLESI